MPAADTAVNATGASGTPGAGLTQTRPGFLRRYVSVGRTMLLFAVLLGLWQWVSIYWPSSLKDVLASPWATITYIADHPGGIGAAARVTLFEAIVGYVIGNVVGLVVGVVCHLFRTLGRSVFPALVVAQAVPVITFSAIVILWFGNDVQARIVLAAYLSFFPMVLNVYRALGDVRPETVTVLRAFGAKRLFSLRVAELPAVLPAILTALRVSTVLAVSGAIVGELFGAQTGLGALLLGGLYYLSGPEVWASIVVSGAVSLVGFGLIALVERRLSWW